MFDAAHRHDVRADALEHRGVFAHVALKGEDANARHVYQPRSARRCSKEAVSMPFIAAPSPVETLATTCGVTEVRRRFDDGLGHALGIVTLEDARADEDRLGAELQDERRVGRGRDAPGAEERHRKFARERHLLNEGQWRLQILGQGEQFVGVGRLESAHLGQDRAQVSHGLDHIAGPGLTLGTDQARALADASQRLAQVRRAAHEGHGEGPLVDVVLLVGRRQHFGLVDVVHVERLEDLGLGEVTDAGLGHDRDGHHGLDPLDHLGVAHPRDAAVSADVGGNALEGHHRDGTRVFGDLGLFGVNDVHDDATAQHVGQSALDERRSDG